MTCSSAETPRYAQLSFRGSGSITASGMAARVEEKLITVTNHRRSALERRAAFHVACNTAAQRGRTITSGLRLTGSPLVQT